MIRRGTLLAACVAASLCARAELIYKSVGADGSVTYSSQPVPGAKHTTAIDIQTLSPEERRAADRLRKQVEGANSELAKAFADRDEAWRRADVEIRDATEKLASAEARLESEREPREDEWIGNVGGGTRLRESYFARLKELEDRVTAARARLDRAYAARDGLK